MTRSHTAGLAAVDDAFALVRAGVGGLSDGAARAPSLLPGWSRGHVITHLARNADGNRNMVDGAIAGEEREQYPGGADRRAADIEAGAQRSARALVEDFQSSHAALVAAWHRVPDDGWERVGISFALGARPILDGLGSRRRELLVHLVDLDLGFDPIDLPADFVVDQAEWLREFRTVDTWPGAPW